MIAKLRADFAGYHGNRVSGKRKPSGFIKSFGGFYQPTYLAEMRRGLVRALRETGGYKEEAAIIEAKRNEMTLGLIYLLRSRESGSFPVSTAELLEQPVSMLEIEASLQVSVAAALEHLN